MASLPLSAVENVSVTPNQYLDPYVDPKVKAQMIQWVEALRSGRYQQGSGTLQSAKGYCCLGVACAELIPPKLQIREGFDGFLVGQLPAAQYNAPAWLAQVNGEFALRVNAMPGVLGKSIQDSTNLSSLNDNHNWTFQQIANAIEQVFHLKET
jgi:hypothetical protein